MTLKELIVVFKIDANQLKVGIQEVNKALDGLSSVVTGTANKISQGFHNTLSAIFNLKTALGALLAGLSLNAVIGEASKFEESILRAWRQASDGALNAGQSYEKFKQTAVDVASSSIFSANQVANAMKVIADRARTVAQTQEEVAWATKLAQASGEDLGTSADAVSRIMMIFEKQNMTSAQAANYLAVLMDKGAVSLGDLGMAFRSLFPMAAAMGWQFKDIASVLGVLSTKGVEGYRAIFALQSILDAAIDPSKGLGKELADAGVQIVDSFGKVKGVLEIVDSMKRLGWTTSDVYKHFGVQMGTVFSTMLETGSDAFSKFNSAMTNSLHGSETYVDKQSEIFQKSLPGVLTDFTNTVNTSFKKIGDDVGAVLKPIIDLFKTWIEKTVEAIDKSDVLKKVGEELTKALAPLQDKLLELTDQFIKWLSTLTAEDIEKGLNGFADGINSIASAIASILPGIEKLAGLIKFIVDNAGVLTGAYIGGKAAGPVGMVAGAVGGGLIQETIKAKNVSQSPEYQAYKESGGKIGPGLWKEMVEMGTLGKIQTELQTNNSLGEQVKAIGQSTITSVDKNGKVIVETLENLMKKIDTNTSDINSLKIRASTNQKNR